jgi:protein-S-isoprenylcysteine O-methyltransferase Ste14
MSMAQGTVDLIFAVAVAALTALLAGAVWSVLFPAKRIWPPPSRGTWQHRLTWVLFCLVFALNAVLLVLDWNSWAFGSELRWVLGVPLVVMGALLVGWGIATLGAKNTSGARDRLVTSGPYAFTRNPQYLGDIVLFVGISVIANSLLLWITQLLTVMVFSVAPWAEELWLEERYGEDYRRYKHQTSRFL